MPSLTAAQKSDIRRFRDGQRQAYNWTVEHLKSEWGNDSEYDMYGRLTVHRHMFGWMREVSAAMQRAGISDAFTAAKMSIRRGVDPLFWYHFLLQNPNDSCPHLFVISHSSANSAGVMYPIEECIRSLL